MADMGTLLQQFFGQSGGPIAPPARVVGQPSAADIFVPQQAPPPAAAAPNNMIDSQLSPIMAWLKQSGLQPAPIDPEYEQRRAMQRGLLNASAGLIANPADNFLTSLARGANAGASGYLDTQDATRTREYQHKQDLMKDIFGLAGQTSMNQYRTGMIDAKNYATDARLGGLEDKLAEAMRHNGQSEAANQAIIDLKLQVAEQKRKIDEEASAQKATKLTSEIDPKTGLPQSEVSSRMATAEKSLETWASANTPTPEVYEAKRKETYQRFGLEPKADGQTTAQPVPQANATAGPPPLAERVVGQTYQSPNGPVIWTGSGWQKAQ